MSPPYLSVCPTTRTQQANAFFVENGSKVDCGETRPRHAAFKLKNRQRDINTTIDTLPTAVRYASLSASLPLEQPLLTNEKLQALNVILEVFHTIT